MSKVATLPLSAEAAARIRRLAGEITIDQLQRAELAAQAIVEPPSQSTLIAMLYAPRLTPLERERIIRLLEARP